MTDGPAPAPTTPKGTSYVILAKKESAWTRVSTFVAASADAAIRDAAASMNAPDGTELVAIPTRSWQPRKVTVETAPRVKLS